MVPLQERFVEEIRKLPGVNKSGSTDTGPIAEQPKGMLLFVEVKDTDEGWRALRTIAGVIGCPMTIETIDTHLRATLDPNDARNDQTKALIRLGEIVRTWKDAEIGRAFQVLVDAVRKP